MAVGNKIGKLLIFSAPSGSGKTTLVKYLMQHVDNLSFSISATSRKIRGGEIDGKDYYYLSADDFRKKIAINEFVEWEEVYTDKYYGTLKSEVERIRNNGQNVVFDVDVVGGVNIKKLYTNDALAIFVMPPSIEVLKQRLVSRGTDTDSDIKTRIDKSEYELTFSNKFDKIIINDELQKAKMETVELVEKFIETNKH
ncbi:MAG: guanylate kinase [Bacteroidota bacterium]